MNQTTPIIPTHRDERTLNASNGLPVRTNLRTGLAWDDLDDTAKDDTAKDVWGKRISAASNATCLLTGRSDASKPVAGGAEEPRYDTQNR